MSALHCQGTAINVLVNSGSPYTIIPKALYDSLFSEYELHESNISPGSYGGSPIAVQGLFLKLRYNTRIVPKQTNYTSPGKALQFVGGLQNLNCV